MGMTTRDSPIGSNNQHRLSDQVSGNTSGDTASAVFELSPSAAQTLEVIRGDLASLRQQHCNSGEVGSMVLRRLTELERLIAAALPRVSSRIG